MPLPKVDSKQLKQLSYRQLCKRLANIETKVKKAHAKHEMLSVQKDEGSILSHLQFGEIKRLDKFIENNAKKKMLRTIYAGDYKFSVISMGGAFTLGSKHKAHISKPGQTVLLSLARTPENIQSAWDAILPSVLSYAPHSISVIGENALGKKADGHEIEITLPANISIENTAAFLSHLQAALDDANVKPGPKAAKAKLMPGSQFISYMPNGQEQRLADFDMMHINPKLKDLSAVYRRVHLTTTLINKLNSRHELNMLSYDKLVEQYNKVIRELEPNLMTLDVEHQVPLRECLQALKKSKASLDIKQQIQSLSAPLAKLNLRSKEGVASLIEYYHHLQHIQENGVDPNIIRSVCNTNICQLLKDQLSREQQIYQELKDSTNPNVKLMLMQTMAQQDQLKPLLAASMRGELGVLLTKAQAQIEGQASECIDTLTTITNELLDAGDTRELATHGAGLRELKALTEDDNLREQLSSLEGRVLQQLSGQQQQEMTAGFKHARKSSQPSEQEQDTSVQPSSRTSK